MVKFKKLENYDEEFKLPAYETPGAAGMDIRAMTLNKETLVIEPGQTVLIKTGFALQVPTGYEVQIRSRSGLSLKRGLVVSNSPGTIDSDYSGEIGVILHNNSELYQQIGHGDRIAQMVLKAVEQMYFQNVEELSVTERGSGGFGSTGNN